MSNRHIDAINITLSSEAHILSATWPSEMNGRSMFLDANDPILDVPYEWIIVVGANINPIFSKDRTFTIRKAIGAFKATTKKDAMIMAHLRRNGGGILRIMPIRNNTHDHKHDIESHVEKPSLEAIKAK